MQEGGERVAEEQIITILIVFALCLNVLGFVFFGLSLKGEKKKSSVSSKHEKSYNLSMNTPEEETISEEDYGFRPIEEEYKPRYQSVKTPDEAVEGYSFPFEPNAPTAPEKAIEAFQERVYTPDPADDFEEKREDAEPETDLYSYKPVYEQEEEKANEKDDYTFRYEPTYMTEEELEKETEPEPIRPTEFQLDLTQEVDYRDEVQPKEDKQEEEQPGYHGDYQLKHAYSKDERYKYEYDDYKMYKENEEEEEEEFDYSIDIDKEHEKYYGTQEEAGDTSRYELYLEKKEEQPKNERHDQSEARHMREQSSNERQLFQPVDITHVPETPLDREEREREETIDIKQFEPMKYETKELFQSSEPKGPDEFDDDEVDRRIEYLMGKMHDPLQGKKKKDPLDEEF